MKQLRPFIPSNGGNKPGFCLQNVRLGYAIAPFYPNAITAWNNTEQHKDRNIPLGIDAPVYFSYKSDGHIGVRLSDGRFWSDGITFQNLEAYEANHEPIYLGWGESVNEVKVIEIGEVMNEGDVHNLYLSGWQRKATQQELKAWVGKPMESFFYGGGKAQYEWLWSELKKAQSTQFVPLGKEVFIKK